MASQQAFADHVWWLVSRASGVAALALLTTSVGLGLAMAGKLRRRPGGGRTLLAIHEQMALTALVAVAIHGLSLLGDSWLSPGPGGIALPFAMPYRPLWTGFGVIAGWMAALLGLSFYLRRRIGARLWRRAHRLTIVVFALVVAHTLGAGTDAAAPWLHWPLLAFCAAITLLFGLRVVASARRSRRLRRSPSREQGAQLGTAAATS